MSTGEIIVGRGCFMIKPLDTALNAITTRLDAFDKTAQRIAQPGGDPTLEGDMVQTIVDQRAVEANLKVIMSNTSLTKCSVPSLMPARVALVRAASREMPSYIRADEVHRALEMTQDRPRLHGLIALLWLTGSRISEALAVRVSDIDFRV